MSFLTQLSLKKASVTLLIAIALVAGGIYAALRMNQELTPDIDFPLVTVITSQPGAGPQDISSGVTEPLEAAMANVTGLRSLQSLSGEGFSVVIAQFDFGHDMKAAEQEISRAVTGARLPLGATAPQVTRLNLNQALPVVELSLAGDMSAGELQRIAQAELLPRLKAIEGVQAVEVIGGTTQQVDVVIDPARMRPLGITAQQVAGVLGASNVSIPSGVVDAGGVLFPVRTVSQVASLAGIEDLVVGVTTADGQPGPVQLKDVARVQVTQMPAGGIARVNGKPSLLVVVTKAQQANTVKVARAAHRVHDEVQAKLAG